MVPSAFLHTYVCTYALTYVQLNTHIINQKFRGNLFVIRSFFISGEFPMRYCNTWLRSLFCYIKNFDIEEFVIRVLHCMYVYGVH